MATTLPGAQVANPPALPNVTGPRAVVPASWSDATNIMRQVLDVLEREGKPAADALLAWINARRTP